MAYTNNVPQGNQQIAFTQPIIQANFGFLQTGIGTEHNFNAPGAGSDMYHLKTSMPNLIGGDPGSLPSGTNGLYYVLAGVPKFYNGTAYFLQYSQPQAKVLKGTAALNSSSFNTVVTLPASSAGKIFVWTPSSNITSKATYSNDWLTDNSNNIEWDSVINNNFLSSNSGLQFQLKTLSSSFNSTYTYVVMIYT